ncbi:MAG: hypothetical protein WCK60_00825 [Candidatus Nomurabacteria bacterium]
MPFSFKPIQTGEVTSTNNNVVPSISSPSLNTQTPTPIGGMPLNDRVEESHKIGPLQIILYVIFGITVLITAVLFGYRQYLLSQIDYKKAALIDQDKDIKTINLTDMRYLSNRIKIVSQVLNEHTSVRTAFLILEKSIENPVTYRSFDLKRNLLNKNYDLKVKAVAASYKAVAQQIDTLRSSEFSKDFITKVSYDGLNLDSNGNVDFNLNMSVLILGKLPESVESILTNSKGNDNTPMTVKDTPFVPTSPKSISASTTQN